MLSDLTATYLIQFAGALSFCQLPAMLIAPRMLRWSDELSSISPLSRRIVTVIGIAIVLIVQGTGVVTLLGAREIAAGTRLGVAYAGLLALFWGYRAGAQRIYAPLWPRSVAGRVAHGGLLMLFWTQAIIFFGACVRGFGR